MMPMQEKKDAFHQAEKLLLDRDETNLRYAVLEIRRCLEAVAYEKLLAYKSRIPPSLAKKWQPPQAFKALIQLEPTAGCSSVIRYAKEVEPGGAIKGEFKQLGRDLRPSNSLLKIWHKLGKYLHANYPFETKSSFITHGELSSILEQLRPFVETSFTCSITNIITFECVACKSQSAASRDGAEKQGFVVCLNPGCEARHNVVIKEGEVFLAPKVIKVECPDCGSEVPIAESNLAHGFRFSCSGCSASFEVAQQWSYSKITADLQNSGQEEL